MPDHTTLKVGISARGFQPREGAESFQRLGFSSTDCFWASDSVPTSVACGTPASSASGSVVGCQSLALVSLDAAALQDLTALALRQPGASPSRRTSVRIPSLYASVACYRPSQSRGSRADTSLRLGCPSGSPLASHKGLQKLCSLAFACLEQTEPHSHTGRKGLRFHWLVSPSSYAFPTAFAGRSLNT